METESFIYYADESKKLKETWYVLPCREPSLIQNIGNFIMDKFEDFLAAFSALSTKVSVVEEHLERILPSQQQVGEDYFEKLEESFFADLKSEFRATGGRLSRKKPIENKVTIS